MARKAKDTKKSTQLTIERKAIADLIFDPNNARTHDKRNIETIGASINRFGQQKPIVIDAKGKVISGNGTLQACIELGMTEIDTVQTELKDEEAKAFAIADNRTAELAEWNFQTLADQLKMLQDTDLSLQGMGWESWEVEPLLNADWSPRNSDGESKEVVQSIALTKEQRAIFEETISTMRGENASKEMTEGHCVKMLCEHYATAEKA